MWLVARVVPPSRAQSNPPLSLSDQGRGIDCREGDFCHSFSIPDIARSFEDPAVVFLYRLRRRVSHRLRYRAEVRRIHGRSRRIDSPPVRKDHTHSPDDHRRCVRHYWAGMRDCRFCSPTCSARPCRDDFDRERLRVSSPDDVSSSLEERPANWNA